MRFYVLSFICFLLWGGAGLFAGENSKSLPLKAAVNVQSEQPVIDLSGDLMIYKDPTGELTFEEISGAFYRDRFQKSDFNPPMIPVCQDIVWARLVLNNKDPGVLRYFYIQFFQLQKVDFFIPKPEGGILRIEAGRSLSDSKHIASQRNVIVPARLPAGEVTVYIRVSHHMGTYYIPTFLADAYGLARLESEDIGRISFYFAFALIIFIINMVIFFVIREKVYLFYSLFILFNSFLLIGLDGFPYVWFDHSWAIMGDWALELAAHLSAIFSILFALKFLQVKSRSFYWGSFLHVLAALFAINAVLSVLGIPVAEPLFFLFVMAGSFAQLGFSIYYSWRDVYARFYSVAWGVHLTIVTLYSLAAVNIVETHIRFPEIMLGSTVELGILAFALGQKFIHIINEKRQIERKVHEVMLRENSLKELTYLDPLTEIYNRRKLDEVLNEFFSRPKSRPSRCSLILLDLDQFKSINDQYGHDIGDHVLVNFTVTVKAVIRKSDIFCRFGGEEFAIFLDDTGVADAMKFAEKIRYVVENERFVNHHKIISVSCGVTGCRKDDTAKSFIKRADDALYQAKNRGRNLVEYVA